MNVILFEIDYGPVMLYAPFCLELYNLLSSFYNLLTAQCGWTQIGIALCYILQ
jgi:hypothetical protein